MSSFDEVVEVHRGEASILLVKMGGDGWLLPF